MLWPALVVLGALGVLHRATPFSPATSHESIVYASRPFLERARLPTSHRSAVVFVGRPRCSLHICVINISSGVWVRADGEEAERAQRPHDSAALCIYLRAPGVAHIAYLVV